MRDLEKQVELWTLIQEGLPLFQTYIQHNRTLIEDAGKDPEANEPTIGLIVDANGAVEDYLKKIETLMENASPVIHDHYDAMQTMKTLLERIVSTYYQNMETPDHIIPLGDFKPYTGKKLIELNSKRAEVSEALTALERALHPAPVTAEVVASEVVIVPKAATAGGAGVDAGSIAQPLSAAPSVEPVVSRQSSGVNPAWRQALNRSRVSFSLPPQSASAEIEMRDMSSRPSVPGSKPS